MQSSVTWEITFLVLLVVAVVAKQTAIPIIGWYEKITDDRDRGRERVKALRLC
jgi:hypothetical protein